MSIRTHLYAVAFGAISLAGIQAFTFDQSAYESRIAALDHQADLLEQAHKIKVADFREMIITEALALTIEEMDARPKSAPLKKLYTPAALLKPPIPKRKPNLKQAGYSKPFRVAMNNLIEKNLED